MQYVKCACSGKNRHCAKCGGRGHYLERRLHDPVPRRSAVQAQQSNRHWVTISLIVLFAIIAFFFVEIG